jgi:hypothetical protein
VNVEVEKMTALDKLKKQIEISTNALKALESVDSVSVSILAKKALEEMKLYELKPKNII